MGGSGLAQQSGDLGPLDHLAPRRVAGGPHAARIDPTTQGVVAYAEVGGRFRYPQMSHEREIYTVNTVAQVDFTREFG